MNTCQNRRIRLTNLVLTLPLFDWVCISIQFEAFSKRLVGSKYISASIAPFFDSRIILLRAPPVGGGDRNPEGMDRVGSINHDPLILSFARFKWIKLQGLILGTVEKQSLLRDKGDIVDTVFFVLEGGGLCCLMNGLCCLLTRNGLCCLLNFIPSSATSQTSKTYRGYRW